MNIPECLEQYGAKEIKKEDIRSIWGYEGIYFLCNKTDILYIGHSEAIGQRIYMHSLVKKFSHIYYIRYEGRKRIVDEKILIRFFAPPLNKRMYPEQKGYIKHMAFIKLNHTLIKKRMEQLRLRPSDIANLFNISRQLTNYILHKGGVKWARQLSVVLKCKEKDLLIRNVVKR